MASIDINCDMGEGISKSAGNAGNAGIDAEIMPFISSANIACGYHAGNVETIIETVLLAKKHGVAVGAHPSFPDRENFGRIEMNLPGDKLYELVTLQIEFLQQLANVAEMKMQHVKPHGALYNMAAKDPLLATTIAGAVKNIDPSIVLFGLSGSALIKEAKAIGLKTASEVFADRTYQEDGTLTPRSQANALIADVNQAVQQALQMIGEGTVTAVTGKKIPLHAETICIHGDGEHAILFAKEIYAALKKEGVKVCCPGA